MYLRLFFHTWFTLEIILCVCKITYTLGFLWNSSEIIKEFYLYGIHPYTYSSWFFIINGLFIQNFSFLVHVIIGSCSFQYDFSCHGLFLSCLWFQWLFPFKFESIYPSINTITTWESYKIKWIPTNKGNLIVTHEHTLQ